MDAEDRKLLTETRDYARDAYRDVQELKTRFAKHCDDTVDSPVQRKRFDLNIIGSIGQWIGLGVAIYGAYFKGSGGGK